MLPSREPTSSQLKYFGLAAATMLAVVAALVHFRFELSSLAAAILAFAVTLAITYYSVPAIQKSIYLGFLRVTYPIQFAVTWIVLAIVYFGLLTPIGICLRWRGIDVRKTADGDSLWVDREPREPSDYFKTY